MKLIYQPLIAIMILLSSCSDFLERAPKNMLTDDQVWQNPAAIEAYIVKLYDQMHTEDLEYTVITEAGYLSQLTDEAVRCYTWGDHNLPIIPEGVVGWWGYYPVRMANEFLKKIEQGSIRSEMKEVYIAEVRFIRAFYYFSMVKRYGGVPILKEPQDLTTDVSSLQVPRNHEKEVYDFIRTEIDDIVKVLPANYPANHRFRATKYSAWALKSRAMLYAASIAKYGQYQPNYFVGIPSADANFYWSESKKASEEIINSDQFELYNTDADKALNFQNVFLGKNHKEGIFTKTYLLPDKGHSFDFYNAPISFRVDYGCVTNPVLEIVEDFEYIDGSEGKLKVNDANGQPIMYANPQDLFKNKDPRMHATIMTPFMPWQGGIVEIRKGIIVNNEIKTSAGLSETYGTGSNTITITGKDGPLDTWDPTKTGFYIKKFMNPNERIQPDRSDASWMVFRYAEILLNFAEASVELNVDTDKALIEINNIRNRAGIKALQTIDLKSVRKERKLELAFENHRWFDIRRWRIAADILNNKRFFALNPYLVWEEGKKISEMKYVFKIEPAPKETRTFLPKLYYEKISSDQIKTNPKLVQNPLY